MNCRNQGKQPFGGRFGGREAVGERKATISAEVGERPRNPTIVTLWHIGKALGVKLQTFFEEGGRRKR
jgi:hypothetical protein